MPAVYYSIKKNRLKTAYMTGIEPRDDFRVLRLTEEPVRRIYLRSIDGAEEGSTWGRLTMDVDLTENMAIYVYAAAVDINTIYDENGTYKIDDLLCSADMADEMRKTLLEDMGALRFVGKTDLLLYGLKGRYLYLAIDVIGEGTGSISNIKVDARGDNFMDTLPEVYRQRNSFLHKYLSVFSSIYNDLEKDIDDLPELLDPDKASVEVLLEYGRWMGIDLSGNFLSEQAIRRFIKESYELNRMKGTRACLKRIFDIILGEDVIILEQNTIRAYGADVEVDSRLSTNSIYDVNVLIKTPMSDTDRRQLLYLVKQFIPVRTKLHLIQLKDSGSLDSDTYLDMNATLTEDTIGFFDEDMVLDDDIIIDE